MVTLQEAEIPAFGFRALTKTTANANVGIGYHSLIENLSGSGNIGIGYNVAAVQADGTTHLTTATDSIYIGNSVRGYDNNDSNSIVIGSYAIGAGANKAVIGSSSITDVYFGSSDANASVHTKKIYLGSSSIPGCIVMGDTSGGVGYITLDNGALTVSSTPSSACQ